MPGFRLGCWSPAALILLLVPIFDPEAIVLGADFSSANLRGARLTNADLRDADLSDADLTAANLSGSDLTGSNITQQQLDNACGSGAKLPAGLKVSPALKDTRWKQAKHLHIAFRIAQRH